MAKIYIKNINCGGNDMNISNMKNIIVLRNLPSNLVDEAIVVLKENKKVKKYQYADDIKEDNVNKQKKKTGKTADNTKEYIIKEAELVVNNYLSNLETKSPKWKNNVKKLEKKYKQSIKLNILLGIATFISIIISVI